MKKIIFLSLVLIVLIFLLGLMISGLNGETVSPLSLLGFTEADIDVVPEVIILKSECYELGMVTTEFQTYSINSGIKNETGFRPTSHDLIKQILEDFEIETLMVKIDSFDEDTYFAKLILKKENKVLNLDARPSDAIAVAVRTNASIYINQTILENNAEWVC